MVTICRIGNINIMNVKRFIPVFAIKNSKNELIPIWDKNSIVYEKSSDLGEYLRLKDTYAEKYFSVVECYYDLKKHLLCAGTILNIYPEQKNLKYSKDEVVYFSVRHGVIEETKIKDILFEEFESIISKGKKIDKYYLGFISNVKIEPEEIYEIRTWKPTYVLENGKKTIWEHELYKKA